MDDLIQFTEYGFQHGDHVDWYRGHASIVPTEHRRRILDRGVFQPHGDGWAYQTREISDGHDTCTTVTRLRWDHTRLYAQTDLDRHLQGWAA